MALPIVGLVTIVLQRTRNSYTDSLITSQSSVNCSVFNNPPVASNQTVFINVNVTTNLTLKGSDPDGDAFTFRTNSLPQHGTLSNFSTVTGAVTYTPVANFTGSDAFTFKVTDGTATSALATVTFNIGTGAADTDGDGMPDSWELAFGLNPNDPTDAGKDADGDGLSNLQEYLSGTSPIDANSALRITAITQESNNLRVTWSTAAGRTNALQRTASGNFSTNTFTSIFTVTNTLGASTNYLDLGGATNNPAGFYRIRLVP